MAPASARPKPVMKPEAPHPDIASTPVTAKTSAAAALAAAVGGRDAEAKVVAGAAAAMEQVGPAPFAHAWKRQRAVQLERNKILARKAQYSARADPACGRGRTQSTQRVEPPAPRKRPASAPRTQVFQLGPGPAPKPNAGAAATTAMPAEDTRRAASPLTAVRPSSASVKIAVRPASSCGVAMYQARPVSAAAQLISRAQAIGRSQPARQSSAAPRVTAASKGADGVGGKLAGRGRPKSAAAARPATRSGSAGAQLTGWKSHE